MSPCQVYLKFPGAELKDMSINLLPVNPEIQARKPRRTLPMSMVDVRVVKAFVIAYDIG